MTRCTAIGWGVGDGAVALDSQTVTVGAPLRDVAYFVGGSLDPALRRGHEERLVGEYHTGILARGIDDADADRCCDAYLLGYLQGPLITVLGCIHARRTVRAGRRHVPGRGDALVRRGSRAPIAGAPLGV